MVLRIMVVVDVVVGDVLIIMPWSRVLSYFHLHLEPNLEVYTLNNNDACL